MLEDYGVGFETVLNKNTSKTLDKYNNRFLKCVDYTVILCILRDEATSGVKNERHCERL